MDFTRRVALVTGGARRVGRAIVERLAGAGFDVAFTFRSGLEEANALEKQLRASGRSARAICADLSDLPAGIDRIEREFRGSFSRLDVLVNNASQYLPGDLAQTDVALMRRLMTVNAEAPLLLCQRFAGDLRASRGHVVNMLDLLAERPWPQYLAYCASKAAFANITLSLARELAPEVTVNAIAPGVVDWPANYPEADRLKYLQRVPLGRPGTPNDVAEAVLYFCTAAPNVTGQILRLDGGRSIT
jgi:pteridine reductase